MNVSKSKGKSRSKKEKYRYIDILMEKYAKKGGFRDENNDNKENRGGKRPGKKAKRGKKDEKHHLQGSQKVSAALRSRSMDISGLTKKKSHLRQKKSAIHKSMQNSPKRLHTRQKSVGAVHSKAKMKVPKLNFTLLPNFVQTQHRT